MNRCSVLDFCKYWVLLKFNSLNERKCVLYLSIICYVFYEERRFENCWLKNVSDLKKL